MVVTRVHSWEFKSDLLLCFVVLLLLFLSLFLCFLWLVDFLLHVYLLLLRLYYGGHQTGELAETTTVPRCMWEYDVVPREDPIEMQKQTGFLATIVAKLKVRFGSVMVKQWREAVRTAGNWIGWPLGSGLESTPIRKIAEEVPSVLHRHYLDVAKHPIGLDKHVQALRMSLHTEDACHMVGICGIAGIGKTTIAKALYNMIADQFQGSSFLANIREISQQCGLHKLQATLLHDILGDKIIQIGNVQTGVNLIRQSFCNKRVLLVLDDVDCLEQLKGLVGEKSWFGMGSRVIITARDEDMLVAHNAEIYKVPALNYDDALQLFSLNAFKKPSPARDYKSMSLLFTRHARGLPLALLVLGSSLCGKSTLEWNHALDRVKAVPEGKIDQILKISYLGLEANERKIFLDIACLLKGKDKDEVVKILYYYNSYPESGLKILTEKLFVYIEANKIWMHDLLQQMGQEIVRLESPENPGKRSRLWSHVDVQKVIRENLWTDAIEGIKLDMLEPEEVSMAYEAIKQMKRLRLVIFNGIPISRCPQFRFNKTDWLTAHGNLLSGNPESCGHIKMTGELNSIEPAGNEKDHSQIRTTISKINCKGTLSSVSAKSSKPGQVFSFRVTNDRYLYDHKLSEKLWGIKNFLRAELLRATNNFSDDHLIGLGGFGSVYRGVLDDGKEVAIKRARYQEKGNYDEYLAFIAEIRAGYLKHKNFVQLFGFHEGESERALVFEYVKNGSLYDHLHTLQSSALKSWNIRLRVALDVARGIEYLHEYADPTMIHCDVRPSNILLDDKWNAKVSDFRKSVLVSESENVVLGGTVGYVDIAFYGNDVNYRLTTRADVYSYGVTLLELLSGQKAAKIVEEGRRIVTIDNVVVPFIQEGAISCVLDPNMPEPRPFEMVAVEDVARLACSCAQVHPEGRPSMTYVVDHLKNALSLLESDM